MGLLEVLDIFKRFGEEIAVDGVRFSLERGRILCLLGPSGCGKTTLLRIIAGLETPDRGSIRFDDLEMEGVPPHLRRFRMMFQEFALFPHKNVFENVAFGPRIQKDSREAVARRTAEMLDLVGLAGFGPRNVGELSGGERQRVALARSLASHPRLLMLDEPLGSLDRALRKRLISDLNHILRKVGVTTILVTHDQGEAFAAADVVAVMSQGRIEQMDSPENLYKNPKNPVVASFLGFENLVEGTMGNEREVITGLGPLFPPSNGTAPGEPATVLLRPESARLVEDDAVAPRETLVSGTVKERVFQGANYHVTVASDRGGTLVFDIPNETPPPLAGELIRLALKPAGMVLMPNGRASNP
ncbi:MAG: ABC transporter ATP-binding protein [Desulfobacterales bacterium]|nr:ABC transporter ATP-binding protein [Desulfobacterales bacterium]